MGVPLIRGTGIPARSGLMVCSCWLMGVHSEALGPCACGCHTGCTRRHGHGWWGCVCFSPPRHIKRHGPGNGGGPDTETVPIKLRRTSIGGLCGRLRLGVGPTLGAAYGAVPAWLLEHWRSTVLRVSWFWA